MSAKICVSKQNTANNILHNIQKALNVENPLHTYPIINQQRHGFRRCTFLNITFHKEEYDGTEKKTRLCYEKKIKPNPESSLSQ